MTWIAVCPIKEVEKGTGKVFSLPQEDVLIVHTEDGFHALRDFCPHQGMSMEGGLLGEDHSWSCPAHGARFHLDTGAPLAMPAVTPVDIYPVKVENSTVWVELEG